METNLAYIEDAVQKAVARQEATVNQLPDEAHVAAKKAASRRVAGFALHDERKERAVLDAMVSERANRLKTFIMHRNAARVEFAGYGIKPLAILPRIIWDRICEATGLFRLTPDKNGQVPIADGWAGKWGILQSSRKQKSFMGIEYGGAYGEIDPLEDVTKLTVEQYRKLLLDMWPGFKQAPEYSDRLYNGNLAYNRREARLKNQVVTVMLPNPPEDVVQVLLKMEGKCQIRVAAVGEAIGVMENLATLRDGAAKHFSDQEAAKLQEWLRYEPFIYAEVGPPDVGGAVICAQFGDFPIEKQVVDRILEMDDLLPEKWDGMAALKAPVVMNQYDEAIRQAQSAAGQQSQANALMQMGQLQNVNLYALANRGRTYSSWQDTMRDVIRAKAAQGWMFVESVQDRGDREKLLFRRVADAGVAGALGLEDTCIEYVQRY